MWHPRKAVNILHALRGRMFAHSTYPGSAFLALMKDCTIRKLKTFKTVSLEELPDYTELLKDKSAFDNKKKAKYEETNRN